MNTRMTGRVKWFNEGRGVGLIHPDRGEDVPVRASAIQGTGIKSLRSGQVVEFDVVQGPDGPQAGRVHPGRPIRE